MRKIRNRLWKMLHRPWEWLLRLIGKWKAGWSVESANGTTEDKTEDTPENPWIYATREVIEQILLYDRTAMGKNMVSSCEMTWNVLHGKQAEASGIEATERVLLRDAYREFRPMILDTDCPNQAFGEEDDVDQILDQLYPGLNFLEICTDRPEHFAAFSDWLEREYGLIVRMLPLAEMHQSRAGMVLDLQRHGDLHIRKFSRDVIYLPFYKRRWRDVRETEHTEDVDGDDMAVPQSKNAVFSQNTGETGAQNLDIEVPIGYNVVIVKVGKTLQKFR